MIGVGVHDNHTLAFRANRSTRSFATLGGIFPGYVPELTKVEVGLKVDLL